MKPQHNFQLLEGGRDDVRSWDQEPVDHAEESPTNTPSDPTWKEDLRSAVAEISEKLEVQLRFNRIEDAVEQLSLEAKNFRVSISSLLPFPGTVKEAIEVNVRPSDDTWVASFFDANVHASGETEIEAIDNLKGALVDTLWSLAELESSQLSRDMQRTFEVLAHNIEIEG